MHTEIFDFIQWNRLIFENFIVSFVSFGIRTKSTNINFTSGYRSSWINLIHSFILKINQKNKKNEILVRQLQQMDLDIVDFAFVYQHQYRIANNRSLDENDTNR